MKITNLLVFAACAFATCVGAPSIFGGTKPKVKMDIFYQSLCPDSANFIQQLWALYPAFKDNLDITFYPFGKSNSTRHDDGTVEFTCRGRGAPECFGNRVQGCVLTALASQASSASGSAVQDAQMEYIACQMNNPVDIPHETCVGQVPMLWYPILECATDDISEAQQLTFERISTPVIDATNWVPSILYNGKLVEESITRDAPPLREVICAYINNDNPECTNTV